MKNQHRYPIFLDMRGVACLVVGGGPIAARKVESLLEAGATVRVVSPEVSPALRKLASCNVIEWVERRYAKSWMKGMRLVIAATSDEAVNHQVYADAELRGIMANVVDDLKYCRFVAPARFSSESLEIAVTTGGAAPIVAKLVRDEIAATLGEKYAAVVKALGDRRGRIKRLPRDSKEHFWKQTGTLLRTESNGDNIVIDKIEAALVMAEGGAQ